MTLISKTQCIILLIALIIFGFLDLFGYFFSMISFILFRRERFLYFFSRSLCFGIAYILSFSFILFSFVVTQ